MDSLLETIDSLRLTQKNYENDPDLFMFDYQADLLKMAVERDRVFKLDKINDEAPRGKSLTAVELAKLPTIQTVVDDPRNTGKSG